MINLQSKKVLIYAEGAFGLEARKKYSVRAKTADGVLRWADYEIAGVIDSTSNEQTVYDVLQMREDVPVFKDLKTAVAQTSPNVLLLGVAPEGGKFPESWRQDVIWAMQNGMDIVAGMHFELSKDEEFSNAAKLFDRKIWDVRIPPTDLPVGSAKAYRINPGQKVTRPIVLTVSSDPAVGKLTTTMAILHTMRTRGDTPCFIPTGQTSIMIGGWGIAIDACVGDFQAGALEKMILEKAEDPKWSHFIVKGQGSIYHPGYSNTTIAMIHGSVPTHMIMVHRPTRKHSIGSKLIKLPPLTEAIEMYEKLILPSYRNCKVVSISLNTFGMTDEEAREEVQKAEFETGLPATDVVRWPKEVGKILRF